MAPQLKTMDNMVDRSFLWHKIRHCWRSIPRSVLPWYMRGNGGVPFTFALHGKLKLNNKCKPCRSQLI